jgi:[ribosomal protein S18]-alanine N-acetyltransferase
MEDLDQVHAIDLVSFSLPWPASAFRYELLDNPHSILWVAETTSPDREVVGLIVVWMILDEAHIANIAVHPEFRRRGVGASLLAVALKDALQKGLRTATLEVRAQNTGAQSLYRIFGFEEVGRRLRYYRDNNEDALLMTVDLTKPRGGGETYQMWLERGGWKSGKGRI